MKSDILLLFLFGVIVSSNVISGVLAEKSGDAASNDEKVIEATGKLAYNTAKSLCKVVHKIDMKGAAKKGASGFYINKIAEQAIDMARQLVVKTCNDIADPTSAIKLAVELANIIINKNNNYLKKGGFPDEVIKEVNDITDNAKKIVKIGNKHLNDDYTPAGAAKVVGEIIAAAGGVIESGKSTIKGTKVSGNAAKKIKLSIKTANEIVKLLGAFLNAQKDVARSKTSAS